MMLRCGFDCGHSLSGMRYHKEEAIHVWEWASLKGCETTACANRVMIWHRHKQSLMLLASQEA